MNRYLLLRDDQEKGPFSLDELRSMQVSPDDLVWVEGKSTIWSHAKDVPGLSFLWEKNAGSERFSENTYSPTAFSGAASYGFSQTEADFSRSQRQEQHAPDASEKTFRFLNRFSWVAVAAGIGLVAMFLTKMARNSREVVIVPKEAAAARNLPDQLLDNTENFQNALTKEIILLPDSTKTTTHKKVKPKNLRSLVKLATNEYKVGLFGGINNLKLTVQNNSDVVLDKVIIKIDYLKPNGEIINSDTLYARMIEPKDSKVIEVPDTKRGVKIQYKVISAKAHEFKVAMSEV